MSDFALTPDELLTTTRTVRKRLDLDRPVPEELIEECISIAVQAPSGANRQNWHWIVVTDDEVRRQLGDFYRRSAVPYLAAAAAATNAADEQDPDRTRVQQRVRDSSSYLAEHMGEVPVLVIPCLRAAALPEGNQAGLWGSVLPAVWSYCLAARSRGLGTAWTTLHLQYEREVAELLGLPDDIRQAAMIPTAYFTGDTFKPAPRHPLDDVLHHNRW